MTRRHGGPLALIKFQGSTEGGGRRKLGRVGGGGRGGGSGLQEVQNLLSHPRNVGCAVDTESVYTAGRGRRPAHTVPSAA